MTLQETASVFRIIQGAYPSWKPSKDTLEVWASVFSDEPMALVIAAIKAFIVSDDKGFAPAIGQIKRIIHKPETDMSELEAWTLIKKAISNGIYDCYEEFEKLPPLLQKIVGDPQQLHSWALLTSGLDTVVASNFQRSYRTEIERQQIDAALPLDVKKTLGLCGHVVASIVDGYHPSTLSGTVATSNATVRTNFREIPETPQEGVMSNAKA